MRSLGEDDRWSLGVEAHGQIESAFGDAPALDDQEHFIGPAVGLRFGEEGAVAMRLALFFGLTRASTDMVASLNLEVGF
jgi:hypothetical protein